MTRLAKIKTKKEIKTIPKDWPSSMNHLFGRIVKITKTSTGEFETHSPKTPHRRWFIYKKEIKYFL